MNKITHISKIAELLETDKTDVINAFLETLPELLCQNQFIATEHFEAIEMAFNQHLDRVIDIDEIKQNAIALNVFNYQNAGVYFLLDEDKELVYVGQAVNVLSRIKEHLKDKVFYYVSYVRFYSEYDLLMSEDANIRHYNPTFNKIIPFSPFSLLKKLIASCEFNGVELSIAEYNELKARIAFKPRLRRTYKQIRQDKEKQNEHKVKATRSIISQKYWDSIGKKP